MELLAFGDTGWGDELFRATLMTIAVSITAMIIGFCFAAIFTPLKLSKFKSLNLISNIYINDNLFVSTNYMAKTVSNMNSFLTDRNRYGDECDMVVFSKNLLSVL